jgi:Na+-driven multidrug efflux pump
LKGGKVRNPNSRRYDREILFLALPALGALAADPTYVLVDTAIVGRRWAVTGASAATRA